MAGGRALAQRIKVTNGILLKSSKETLRDLLESSLNFHNVPSPLSLITPIYIKQDLALLLSGDLRPFRGTRTKRKERSANSVPIRYASLIHLEKERQTKQTVEFAATGATNRPMNIESHPPHEVRKRERGSEAKERGRN